MYLNTVYNTFLCSTDFAKLMDIVYGNKYIHETEREWKIYYYFAPHKTNDVTFIN